LHFQHAGPVAKFKAKIIKEGSGRHFDPQLIKVFNRVSEQFAAIAGVQQGA